MKVKLLIAMFLLLGIAGNVKAQIVKLNGVIYYITPYPDSEGGVIYEATIGEIEDKTATNLVIASNVEYDGQSYPVTRLNRAVFSGCENLASIEVSPESTSFCSEDGVLFNKDKTQLYVYPRAKQGNPYFIPQSVTTIATEAFRECTGLVSLKIPATVIQIGTVENFGNFHACSALLSIEVNSENPSFSSIDGVLFNKTVKTLYAYPGGKQGEYTVPENVTKIEFQAFSQCINLTSITISGNVKKIEGPTFYGCLKLSSVEILEGVEEIGVGAFENCFSLCSINIPSSMRKIGGNAFCYCRKLASINIPDGVMEIGAYAFNECRILSSIIIPGSVSSLEGGAFKNCTSLLSVELLNGMSIIENYAFDNCSSMISLILPTSIEKIGIGAFRGCVSLSNIYSRAEIPPVTGYNSLGEEVTDKTSFESDIYTKATLHVPVTHSVIYKDAKEWNSFLNIIEEDPMAIDTNELLNNITYTDGILYLPEDVSSKVFIYTPNGNLIQNRDITTGGNCDLSEMPEGVYIIKVKIGERKVSLKIIK